MHPMLAEDVSCPARGIATFSKFYTSAEKRDIFRSSSCSKHAKKYSAISEAYAC